MIFQKICPCGSQKDYLNCCGNFITGETIPPTPEALMRSRYTAYSEINIDYIQKTMKEPAALNFNKEETEKWAKQVKWLGLKVIDSQFDNLQGTVEFMADYSYQGKKLCLHEVSEFKKENGQWFYTKGKTPPKSQNKTAKIGRNDPCPCGSNKKFKKCCDNR